MKTRTRAILLSLALLTMLVPVTAATVSDMEPSMQAISKTVQGAKIIEFTKSDFDSRVNGGKVLEGIIITTLPDAELGELKFGNRRLMIGEAVPSDGLAMLRFIPSVSGEVRTTFEFLPVFDGGVSLDSVEVSLNLITQENRPPSAEKQELTTYKNIALTAGFKATDPDGDPLSYKITSKPKRGTVEIMRDGTFVYTPYQNKTGKDSFVFVVTDSNGNSSADTEIMIKIDKPGTKTKYADMEGNGAHYAAIRVMENGIFAGEQLGGEYYFNPEREVTRGEFIVMALNAAGMKDLMPVTRTGFADDALTPAWVKPYAAAALKAGIISGIAKNDGRKILDADAIISKAEAAVILNNAMRFADAEIEPVYSDFDAIPVWAYKAAVNLETTGVLSTDEYGALGLDTTVTRANAAQMLTSSLDTKAQNTKKTGLLSWAFD